MEWTTINIRPNLYLLYTMFDDSSNSPINRIVSSVKTLYDKYVDDINNNWSNSADTNLFDLLTFGDVDGNNIRAKLDNNTYENLFVDTFLDTSKIYNEYYSNVIYSNHSLWLINMRNSQHSSDTYSKNFKIYGLPYDFPNRSIDTYYDPDTTIDSNEGLRKAEFNQPKTFVISGFPELKRFGLKDGDNIININGRYTEIINIDIPKMLFNDDNLWDYSGYHGDNDDMLNYFNDDKYHPDSYDFDDNVGFNTLNSQQQETMKKKIGIRTTNVFYMDVKKPGTSTGETIRIYLMRRIKYRPFQTLRYPSLTYSNGNSFKIANFYEGKSALEKSRR